MYVAKTKALISFAVTAKVICVFVFAYAKSRFSHDAAHLQDLVLKFLSALIITIDAVKGKRSVKTEYRHANS